VPSEQHLQQQIESALAELRKRLPNDNWPHVVTSMTYVAEVLAASSELANESARKVVRLTWALLILTGLLFVLTATLLVFSIVQIRIMVQENPNTNTHHQQLPGEHYKAVTNYAPPEPNR
jgi:hypothetical protein